MKTLESTHNWHNRIPDVVNNYTISNLSKTQCITGIIKKLNYYLRLKHNIDIESLTTERWKYLTPERIQEYKNVLEKHNILIVVDNEMVEMQSKILWTSYAAGSFGDIIAFRSWQDLEQRNHLVRHEVIHNKQVQDLWWGIIWFIKWLAISWKDFLKILNKYKWVIPRANDHATANQLTDRETYLNQSDENYLDNRKPNQWLSFVNQSTKNKLVEFFMNQELNKFIQQTQDINWDTQNTANNVNLKYNFIKDIHNREHDIWKIQELQHIHQNNNRHQMVTYWSIDRFTYKETTQEHQLHFISETALRKKVWLDAFMAHYDIANNYEKWSQKYLENKSIVDPIIEQFVQTNNIKELKKQLLNVYKHIEKSK